MQVWKNMGNWLQSNSNITPRNDFSGGRHQHHHHLLEEWTLLFEMVRTAFEFEMKGSQFMMVSLVCMSASAWQLVNTIEVQIVKSNPLQPSMGMLTAAM